MERIKGMNSQKNCGKFKKSMKLFETSDRDRFILAAKCLIFSRHFLQKKIAQLLQ